MNSHDNLHHGILFGILFSIFLIPAVVLMYNDSTRDSSEGPHTPPAKLEVQRGPVPVLPDNVVIIDGQYYFKDHRGVQTPINNPEGVIGTTHCQQMFNMLFCE